MDQKKIIGGGGTGRWNFIVITQFLITECSELIQKISNEQRETWTIQVCTLNIGTCNDGRIHI